MKQTFVKVRLAATDIRTCSKKARASSWAIEWQSKDIQIYVSKVFKCLSKGCWMDTSYLMDIKQSRLSSEKAACRCVDAWNAGWASGAKQTKSRMKL